MTLTTEQLDELERRARAELSAFIPLRVSTAPDVALHLVAVYRAALEIRQQLLDLRPTSMLHLARANMLATIQQALDGEP